MRTIRFRAKAINDGHYKGEWVYGYYMKSLCGGELVDVITDGANEIPIQIDTLGQFTGLYDKSLKSIYDGDILKYGDELFAIEFHHGCFGYIHCKQFVPLGANTNFTFYKQDYDNNFEIIGNIHDNPDLMK